MDKLTDAQLDRVPDDFELTSTNLDMEYWWDGPGGDIILQFGHDGKWYLQGNGFREREFDDLEKAFSEALGIMKLYVEVKR